MVAAISNVSQDPKGSNSTRPPLIRENGNGVHNSSSNQQQRRQRAREVPSRYMSSISMSPSSSTTSTTSTTTTTTSSSSSSSSFVSRRFPSPIVSSNVAKSSLVTPKRSQSVDRRRSMTPKTAPLSNGGDVSAAAKLLVTSTRSLSVSFQGGAFSLPVSKTKVVNQVGNNGRKLTPERRRSTPQKGRGEDGRGGGGGRSGDLVENSKPGDQHRWPARTRPLNVLSKSSDCSNGEGKEFSRSSVVARALQESLLEDSRRASFDGILKLDSRNGDVLCEIRGGIDANLVNESSVPSDLTASDTESISSGSTSGAQEMNGRSNGRSAPRGIVVSARFWQETNMRLRRLQDPTLGLSSSPASKFVTPPKLSQSRKFSDGPVTSPRMMSSPIRGAIRAASPSKLMSSPSPMRGLSPSRVRSSIGGMLACSPWDTPSVLSFAVDVRRGKVGENRIVDAHQLRLLYNRHFQWRFVNARTDAALSMQRQIAEKNMWNAWINTTALRDSVKHKRAQVQLLRQKLRLSSILRGHMAYLEKWSDLDKDHCSSLQGAIEALKASTLRLPVVGGATSDIRSVKEAIGSAVDVMQSMAASTSSLLTKFEEVNFLMAELSNVATKERVLLERCKEVLSVLLSMQVRDCSFRTHKLQINRSP